MNKILNDPNGKAICVLLYSIGAFCAAKKKPLPNCLAFGFTWWLPIKKGE